MVKVRELATLHVPAEDTRLTIDENGNIVAETPRPAYDRVLPPMTPSSAACWVYRPAHGGTARRYCWRSRETSRSRQGLCLRQTASDPRARLSAPRLYAKSSLMGASYMQLSMGQYELTGRHRRHRCWTSPSRRHAAQAGRLHGHRKGGPDLLLQVTTHSLTVQATDRPADLLPFQQDELTPGRGRILYRRRQGLPALLRRWPRIWARPWGQSAPVPGGAEEYP